MTPSTGEATTWSDLSLTCIGKLRSCWQLQLLLVHVKQVSPQREREREGERESFICSIIICIDAREEERGGGINRGQEDVICFCLKSSWPFYYCFRDWKSLSKIINYTRGREREKEVVQWETNSILSNPGHHHADKLVRVSKTSLETLLTLGERPLSSICVSHSPHK